MPYPPPLYFQGSLSFQFIILPFCFCWILKQFLVEPSQVKGGSISFSGCIQLVGFCVFEACVGIFWPSIMKMRSQYIPEEARSTIMNFFRIPLNIFVCVVLYNVRMYNHAISFCPSCQLLIDCLWIFFEGWCIPNQCHVRYVLNFPVRGLHPAAAPLGDSREAK